MITLARESRGYNHRDFAVLVDMSNSNLGKIESGEIGVTQAKLLNIASQADYPLHFFFQEGEIKMENLSWKKRRKVPYKLLFPILAKANIITLQVQILNKALNPQLIELPTFEISESLTPQDIAKKVRTLWDLEKITSNSLLKAIEDKGIVVSEFDFKSTRIDGLSMLTNDQRPVIFLNSTLDGDKQRFTLAYELGQLIMHTFFVPDVTLDPSKSANLFAAELLMPESEMRKEFENGITFQSLALLKKKWRVSMIALLYRADDLGYLTSNQKRYLIQQFNERNIRRYEPEELRILPERPRLLKFLIGEIRNKGRLTVMDTANLMCLEIGEFMELYS